jgi:hypothetical protein
MLSLADSAIVAAPRPVAIGPDFSAVKKIEKPDIDRRADRCRMTPIHSHP